MSIGGNWPLTSPATCGFVSLLILRTRICFGGGPSTRAASPRASSASGPLKVLVHCDIAIRGTRVISRLEVEVVAAQFRRHFDSFTRENVHNVPARFGVVGLDYAQLAIEFRPSCKALQPDALSEKRAHRRALTLQRVLRDFFGVCGNSPRPRTFRTGCSADCSLLRIALGFVNVDIHFLLLDHLRGDFDRCRNIHATLIAVRGHLATRPLRPVECVESVEDIVQVRRFGLAARLASVAVATKDGASNDILGALALFMHRLRIGQIHVFFLLDHACPARPNAFRLNEKLVQRYRWAQLHSLRVNRKLPIRGRPRPLPTTSRILCRGVTVCGNVVLPCRLGKCHLSVLDVTQTSATQSATREREGRRAAAQPPRRGFDAEIVVDVNKRVLDDYRPQLRAQFTVRNAWHHPR
mmetsp:Transcript_63265/g.176023  ORF Transcript_63265/g.176023 Transcript_63265/m.176023 type:complete len:410 (-) Transcript_63265:459-1688(-)